MDNVAVQTQPRYRQLFDHIGKSVEKINANLAICEQRLAVVLEKQTSTLGSEPQEQRPQKMPEGTACELESMLLTVVASLDSLLTKIDDIVRRIQL